MDVLLGVIHLQKKQLSHNRAGYLIIDWRTNENNPVLQETGIDIHGLLAAARVFDDMW